MIDDENSFFHSGCSNSKADNAGIEAERQENYKQEMAVMASWAGSPEVSLVSETGWEVRVHRILLGLYSQQWRQILHGLSSTELVFIMQGMARTDLQELLNNIYKPLYETQHEEDESDGKRDISDNSIEVVEEIDTRTEDKVEEYFQEILESKGTEGCTENVDSKHIDLDDLES